MAWGAAGKQGVDDLVRRLLANDSKLTSLTIMKNRKFGHAEAISLCAALKGNSQLTELYASNHVMSSQTAAVVSDLLATTCTLKMLCVGDAAFGDAGLAALAPGLQTNQSLTRLDLQSKGLTQEAACQLAIVLAQNHSLSTLQLSGNEIGDPGAAGLVSRVWSTLRILDLSSCGISAIGIHALARSESMSHLSSLVLRSNNLVSDSGSALAALLGSASRLTSIDLSHNDLQDEGCSTLCSAITSRGALQILDLSSTGAGARTCETLARVFSSSGAALTDLVLSDNPGSIDDASAAVLGVSLSQTGAVALQRLDLAGAKVGVAAILALSGAPALVKLSLFSCPLAERGVVTLAAQLSKGGFTSLRELVVSGCGVTLIAAEALMQVLATGSGMCLKYIEIGANPACETADAMNAAVDALTAVRPDVEVLWHASNQQPGGGNEEKPANNAAAAAAAAADAAQEH